jgi:xanthine dehydrogenase accessory factor
MFMFHDHEWEKEFLPTVLATNALYIGAMGSRSTHRTRLRQLEEKGFNLTQFQRIHGPAGLFPSAKSAADISLSILAEIMQMVRNTTQHDLGLDGQSYCDTPAHESKRCSSSLGVHP